MATIDEAGRELLLKYLRYYYNERGWHVMPKLSGKKHTHLAYVQQDNKAHDRYDLAFLEQEIKEVNFIDGLVLRAGYVNDATSITGMDYDPRNDPSGKGKKIIDELLACEDDWLIADTPGGGIHIFCHYDPEIKIVLLPGTGIEFKFNHLMVLPPSWNKDKTAAYKFRDPKSPIIALTDKHKAILGLDKIAEKELVEGPKRKIEEILDFKDKIEPGNRHHTLVQVALQIQLSKLPAILGKKLYYDFVKQNCPELLIDRVQEVERIFSDSLNFDYVQEQLKNENEAVTIANRRTWLNPYTPQEMADYVRPKEHWAIEHFVPLYTTTVLTSNPKVGKTMQLIDMAIALATGRKYLDTYETVQGNVLYVDLELDMPEMKRRLDLFGFHKDMPIHFIHDKWAI
ncbi:AAA family ATPase [Candidatus Pacearchaeota archaeon]|nr:AAA family ATPase [Candidatus Pacearchaeota archaeon]